MDDIENEDYLETDGFEMAMIQNLPVSNFDHYDPSIPPESGVDYLRRVQLEAMKEPDIKAVDISSFIKVNPVSVADIYEDEFVKSIPEFRIPDNVIEGVIENFKKLRSHIDKLRKENGNIQTLRLTKRRWKEFCFNKNENNKINLFSNYQMQFQYNTNVPKFSIICRLSQKEIYFLLAYHLEWLKEEEFSIGNGLWLYALLAVLDTLLPADVYDILRRISRLFSQIRHSLELNQTLVDHYEKLSSLNIVIIIIGNFFGQKDLLDSWPY